MEVINLNLIPNGTNPVVHVSQYDEGRDFRFNLFDGTSVLTLDGTETIECDVKKPDGNIVTVAVPNTSDSYIVVTTTLQMTACGGNSLGTIKISKGGINLYTLNFVLYCERSPLENGIESESAIHDLQTQIAEGVAEEVAEQYDSGNVIFDNEPTDNHGIGYTVTSEGIKTAIDNAFDYDNTASGSLVHIEDGADNIPVKSLVSEIVAVESGSGEKSPTNPYTISGFDSGVITRCGKNLFSYDLPIRNGYWTNDSFVGDNAIVPKESAVTWQYIRVYVEGLSSITLSGFDNQGGTNCAWLSSENVNDVISRFNSLSKNGTKTVPSGAKYLCLTIYNIKDKSTTYPNAQLEIGDTATTYEAYNGNTYTFAFGQTVYGGHFDNKGNLVVTHGIISDLGSLGWGGSDGQFNYSFNVIPKSWTRSSENWGKCSALKVENWNSVDYGTYSNNSIHGLAFNTIFILRVYASDYSTAEDLKTALSGQSLIYELATPTTLTITSQDIPTLLGENNIFSNCGDVEITYYTSKSNDILEFINSEIDKKNGTNIPIEANSQDSIKDYVDDEVSTINTSLSNKASKTEDTTITLASGYSLISSSCGKTDRLVHLNFNVEKSGGFSTGWQVIGTTEFKPNTLAYCPLWNVTNGVGNGEVRIDTDGTINFYIVTAGELRLNANIGYITD